MIIKLSEQDQKLVEKIIKFSTSGDDINEGFEVAGIENDVEARMIYCLGVMFGTVKTLQYLQKLKPELDS